MFKKLLCFLFILISSNSIIHALNYAGMEIDCAPQLRGCVQKILRVQEARNLIAQIQQDGPIKIVAHSNHISQQFGACWDEDNRIIIVDTSNRPSEGDMIGSILFELQNAAINAQFIHFDNLASTGSIGKEKYVEAIERLEYENSKKASAIATKGIQEGIFPESAHLPTYRNFQEHFHFQKIGGHSAIIEFNYNQLRRRW